MKKMTRVIVFIMAAIMVLSMAPAAGKCGR